VQIPRACLSDSLPQATYIEGLHII